MYLHAAPSTYLECPHRGAFDTFEAGIAKHCKTLRLTQKHIIHMEALSGSVLETLGLVDAEYAQMMHFGQLGDDQDGQLDEVEHQVPLVVPSHVRRDDEPAVVGERCK